MGMVYDGPYAEDVNRGAYHEGYPARVMPDGTLTGTWGGEHGWDGHTGFVAACDCGWRSDRTRPPGDIDGPEYEAALRDFQTEHLEPLVEAARRQSWPRWTSRVTGYADHIASLAVAGRFDDADDQLDALHDEIAGRRRVIAELRAEQQYRHFHETSNEGLAFTPLTDTPPPAPPANPPPPPPTPSAPFQRR